MIRSSYGLNYSFLEVKVDSANVDFLVKVKLGEFLLSCGNGVVEKVKLLKGGMIGSSVHWVNEIEVVELGGAQVNSSDVSRDGSVNGFESILGSLLHVVPEVELLEVSHGLVAVSITSTLN